VLVSANLRNVAIVRAEIVNLIGDVMQRNLTPTELACLRRNWKSIVLVLAVEILKRECSLILLLAGAV
jgi:hypothetical protein